MVILRWMSPLTRSSLKLDWSPSSLRVLPINANGHQDMLHHVIVGGMLRGRMGPIPSDVHFSASFEDGIFCLMIDSWFDGSWDGMYLTKNEESFSKNADTFASKWWVNYRGHVGAPIRFHHFKNKSCSMNFLDRQISKPDICSELWFKVLQVQGSNADQKFN